MQDKVLLQIGGQKIENFFSYSIEADIYTADHAFNLELAKPETKIGAGKLCELFVNGETELTGIIDKVTQGYDKSGVKLKVEGRDLCGLIVDSYCEEFIDVQGMTVKALAQRLLKNVTYVNRKHIDYQDNLRGNLKRKKGKSSPLALVDQAQTFSKIEPGQTIFEALKTFAMSRGMMFFAMPDGTLVFGKPLSGGQPSYHLITKKNDPQGNNILEATFLQDISKRYSKIKIVGQQQGTDSLTNQDGATGAAAVNTMAIVTDPSFPEGLKKPYVAVNNNDSRSPKLQAQMLVEKMKFEGFQLQYKVRGHSQNGANYGINKMCHVTDEVLGLDENYLIYGRTFEKSKQGVFTTLKVGLPGVVQ